MDSDEEAVGLGLEDVLSKASPLDTIRRTVVKSCRLATQSPGFENEDRGNCLSQQTVDETDGDFATQDSQPSDTCAATSTTRSGRVVRLRQQEEKKATLPKPKKVKRKEPEEELLAHVEPLEDCRLSSLRWVQRDDNGLWWPAKIIDPTLQMSNKKLNKFWPVPQGSVILQLFPLKKPYYLLRELKGLLQFDDSGPSRIRLRQTTDSSWLKRHVNQKNDWVDARKEVDMYLEAALSLEKQIKKGEKKAAKRKRRLAKEELTDDEDDPLKFAVAPSNVSSKNRPRLYAGDTIFYRSPVFTAGDPRGERSCRVVEIDPSREFPLVLENEEFLPRQTYIKVIAKAESGLRRSTRDDGAHEPIDGFHLIPGRVEIKKLADHMRQEVQRINGAITKVLKEKSDRKKRRRAAKELEESETDP